MARFAGLFSILFLFISANIFSQVGGTGTYNFLSLTGSARAAALGGKNISVTDNTLELVYLNPALLTPETSGQISLSYINYFAEIGYGYAAYSQDVDSIGTFAAGMQYIDYGTFQGAEANGNKTNQFYARDYALNIMYSRPIDSSFRVGANLKPVYSSYETYNSVGLAADFGVVYTSRDKSLAVAATIRNIGFQITKYTDDREQLSYEILLGVSKKLSHAPFRLSITAHNLQKYNLRFDDEEEQAQSLNPELSEKTKLEKFGDNLMRHLIFGVDFLPSKSFYVSAAYNYQRRKEMALLDYPGTVGFSFGAGIHLKRFSISYGRSVYHVSGGSNHFSLLVNLTQGYSK